MSSYKVHYFPGYGKAEPIRMLLAHAKIEFEDVHYTPETLPAAKASGNLEFGQMPVLEKDGKFYSQSQAILRFLGKELGYYPEDTYHGYLVDSTLDFINDLTNARFKANNHPEPETKKQLLADFYEKVLSNFFLAIQKRLEANSSPDKIVGDKVTIADIALAAIAYSFFLNENNLSKTEYQEVLNKFPKVLDYFNGLGELLKEYLAARAPSPW
ncbi:glutathione s-transferase [Stylonychia lemnae]|uniref:Glutathione s-transferase n=1 Tax=Stylonychia lemnae TaxID=5949 RepID=A0A078A8N2_STYLE|nr:glutathione s-transferase [Stylonychia lemnae]|eukprot:CDW77882.1 glutathione s-transferase [Stylonychia lemnae]